MKILILKELKSKYSILLIEIICKKGNHFFLYLLQIFGNSLLLAFINLFK